MSFRYILRYLIDPRFDAEARMEELVSFCTESCIEEVMLFVTAEELSTGHPTQDELSDYISLGKQLKQKLDFQGISLSLNPWSTIYHNFRGRKLREGQNFRRMVGETGAQNPVAACPLCPEWQHYIQESFSRMAREIQPTTLWIEDDWRLRNHDKILGWGGCFCEEHLRLFSNRIGEKVDRQTLLAAILRPGRPHEWRKVWFELSCETLVTPLGNLSKAIRQANPGTRVALMSSSPDAHSSEGRIWDRFQAAVGTDPTFITRPNMAPYTQVPALQAPPSLSRMTLANLTGDLEIYPELENSPRCGPYSKSARYSGWQMMNCAFIGSHGVTINHYDMLGNGTALDPHFGKELRRLKPFLNAIADQDPRADDREADGVEILFSPQVSTFFQPNKPQSISDLMQESYLWGDTCGILGISHRYVSAIRKTESPVLVSGQTLRAYGKADLELLFRGSVVLDADSVRTALDLGLEDLIGVNSAKWVGLNESAYSYEEILEEDVSVYGLKYPRMTAQRCASSLLSMDAQPSARILSRICQYDHTPLWPGSLLFENSLGGRVVAIAYPVRRDAQYFMGFFNVFRSIFLQRLFFKIAPEAPLAMAAEHPLHCYRHTTPRGMQLALSNPTDDPVESVTIDLPVLDGGSNGWQQLNSEGRWNLIRPEVEEFSHCHRLRFPIRLGYLEGALLRRDRKP